MSSLSSFTVATHHLLSPPSHCRHLLSLTVTSPLAISSLSSSQLTERGFKIKLKMLHLYCNLHRPSPPLLLPLQQQFSPTPSPIEYAIFLSSF
ncbi:hypothetical protein Pint_02895 [Pistacia integerrima]|uniref:Uncharacterized protein n=1 Tax=Pistacia integerrima TaxID=434235 RepID=A0ACC0ZGJ6_9ROSI|nr:hypothetical protein Pint_02895 [Pistacia integerrima]